MPHKHAYDAEKRIAMEKRQNRYNQGPPSQDSIDATRELIREHSSHRNGYVLNFSHLGQGMDRDTRPNWMKKKQREIEAKERAIAQEVKDLTSSGEAFPPLSSVVHKTAKNETARRNAMYQWSNDSGMSCTIRLTSDQIQQAAAAAVLEGNGHIGSLSTRFSMMNR